MPASQSLQTAEAEARLSPYERRLRKLESYLENLREGRLITPSVVTFDLSTGAPIGK